MPHETFSNLQQTATNRWQARYHGNYGVYTVKIAFDANGRRKDFSCTCPSDYHPCKHIGFLERDIKEKSAKIIDEQRKNELTVEDILQNVTLDELRTFVIKKAKFNSDLTKAITLEFAEKQKETSAKKAVGNIYKPLVEADLHNVEFDLEDEDYYYEGTAVDLSVLGDWYDKAESLISQKKYEDALQICQAVIEEYAEWYEVANGDTRDYIHQDFQEDFFYLLIQMAKNEQIDKYSLYEYCKQELQKKVYYAEARNSLNDLMSELANAVNPDEFIAMQNELLKKVVDKSSHEAETIVRRLYDFYLSNNQKDKAEKLAEKNLQIESFCKFALEKRIAENRLSEAKQLILNFEGSHSNYRKSDWNNYKLQIAQKEKDKPAIRKIAFEFIESRFDKKYFTVYKSAFSVEEWTAAFEKLYQHYEKQGKSWYFQNANSNILDLLVAEQLTDRLLDYVNTHLTAETMERYYTHFVEKYPEKSLKMWRNAVDFYAEKNVGEKYYENVCRWLKIMKKLAGGEKMVSEMIDNYRIVYKRRSKMMELLGRISENNERELINNYY